MVGKAYPTGCFKKDFLDYVIRVTAGHVGAVIDFLAVVWAHDVSLRIKLRHSLTMISSHTVNSSMTTSSTRSKSFRANFLSRTSDRVSRGPVYSDVGSPTLGSSKSQTSLDFFRAVLKSHYVTMETLDSTEDKETPDECFKRGWLHATAVQAEIRYIFPTPLHQWFIEYYLGTKVADPTPSRIKIIPPLQSAWYDASHT